MISPTERKQQKEKKNSSYFLSTPKLVYYVYLMALHEEAVRPWTCNDPCFHTEHMDFSAGVCLDRAHCQLRRKHPWASRKTKTYLNIALKKSLADFEYSVSMRHILSCCFTTGHIPVGAGCPAGSALFMCKAPFCSILSCVTQHLQLFLNPARAEGTQPLSGWDTKLVYFDLKCWNCLWLNLISSNPRIYAFP